VFEFLLFGAVCFVAGFFVGIFYLSILSVNRVRDTPVKPPADISEDFDVS